MAKVGFVPGTVVEETPVWMVVVNQNQNLLGKTMLVLRRPCTAVALLTPEEWMSLHVEIRRLVTALDVVFHPDQFNLAFLMNEDAQVHLHVIPRYASPRHWNGHRFKDPHWGRAFGHEQRLLELDDLQQMAREIAAVLTDDRPVV